MRTGILETQPGPLASAVDAERLWLATINRKLIELGGRPADHVSAVRAELATLVVQGSEAQRWLNAM